MTGNTSNLGCPFSGGPPEYGKHTPLTYNNYLRVHELKQLQQCQSDPAHHDEPLFIIIHQTYELWFKLILHEIDQVMKLLAADQVRRSTFFLHRVVEIFKVLVSQIHVLETMSPVDFLGFRAKLNPASGFQSSQFREIEIACGLRDKMLLEHFKQDGSYEDLRRRTEAPSLQESFYELLRRRGFNLPELPLSHDPSTPEAEQEASKLEDQRLQELRRIWEKSDEYGDLHDLAETLIDIDEQLTLWRTHHVTVVERVIGFKRGTGGSEGVGYLRTTVHKRCFPDLWKVRTVLECP